MNAADLNPTHDPALRSWVASANAAGADFPIQNLPFAVFSPRTANASPRCGVGIGDQILDVGACAELMDDAFARNAALACRAPALNEVMQLGQPVVSALRRHKFVPIAYNGRANSVRVSGEPVRRPMWAYEDLNERAQRTAALLLEPQWQSYVAKMLPLLQKQDSKILTPASFFNPLWQDT